MKLRKLTLPVLLGYGAYVAYQNRDRIKQQFTEAGQAYHNIQADWQNIQTNLDIIRDQLNLIDIYKEDLTYKMDLFNRELSDRKAIIEERLEKWQVED